MADEGEGAGKANVQAQPQTQVQTQAQTQAQTQVQTHGPAGYERYLPVSQTSAPVGTSSIPVAPPLTRATAAVPVPPPGHAAGGQGAVYSGAGALTPGLGSAGPTSPYPPGSAGQWRQLATPSAISPGQLLTSHDSRNALQVLRSFKPDGWSSTEAKIFVQGMESGTTSGALSSGANSAGTDEPVSHERRKQLGFSEDPNAGMPQFLSFDQLSSAVDVARLAILKEFHCVATYTKDFRSDDRQILARVYVFSQPEGAYGAYYLLRQGASTVVQRGDGSSEDEQGISFWQGHLFISIHSTGQDDDEGKLLVRSLADKLSASLTDHAGMPQIVNHLPYLMKVKGSDRIVMGPLSAKRFFPAPFVNTLDLKSCIAAAVADYQVQSPPDRLKLLYILFPNPSLAAASYAAYTTSFEGKAVSFEAPPVGESAMYKSNGTFVLCQQAGPRLSIIMGARKRASAALLANYLY